MTTNNPFPDATVAVFDSHVVTPAIGAIGTRFLSDVRARAYPLAPLFRQWELDAADIEGATDGAYVAAASGALVCNAGLAGAAEPSAAVTVGVIAPVNTLAPAIASTSTIIGSPITLTPGAWTGDPAPTILGEWLVNDVVTPATSENTVDTATLNVGDVVSYRETADNGETATATSNTIVMTVGEPMASGTIADITAEEATAPIEFDAEAFFEIVGDPAFEQGVQWSITGTGASIDDEGNVTILRTTARPESAYEITCANTTGSDGQIFNVTVTASPITVPVLGMPVIGDRTVTYPLNVSATVYWVLGTDVELSAAEIKAVNQTFAAGAGTNTQGITIANEGMQYLHLLADRDGLESNIAVAILDAQNPVSASVLSALTATPGTTAATFTVTTDQGNGTIYRLIAAGTPDAATIIATGVAQAVTAAGVVGLPAAAGLTAETGYDVHAVQVNGQGLESNVVREAFTTAAAPTGGVTINGTPTITCNSTASGSGDFTCPAAITDPVGGALVVIIGYRTTASIPPLVNGATLGGAPLPLIAAPISYDNSKPWIAIGWLTSPPAGASDLVFNLGGVEQRAMAIGTFDLSGVGSWRAAEAFSDPGGAITAAEVQDPWGAASPAFAAGDMAFGVIALDGGDIELPTAFTGNPVEIGNTGGTGSSDVTFGLSYNDLGDGVGWTWTSGLSERGLTIRLIADAA